MPYLRCDQCQTLLPGAVVNTVAPVECPACRTALIVQVFPAFFRPVPVGRAAEGLASEEDAGCFYHPRKKAVVPCGDCGRFLCALCDLEIEGRHRCPACVAAAHAAGRSLRATSRRTLHDRLALVLAVAGPLVFVFPSLVTAPVALYLAIRYWNEPAASPVPRSRVWLWFAVVLAGLQVSGWIVYFALRATGSHWLD